MIQEFREFLQRGNVVDLAVAVIVGGAFGAIVDSLVNDLIMPLIGIVLGGVDFTGLTIQVGNASILYGNLIQTIINFLIIAFVLFLVVRSYNRLAATKEETPPSPQDRKNPRNQNTPPEPDHKLLLTKALYTAPFSL